MLSKEAFDKATFDEVMKQGQNKPNSIGRAIYQPMDFKNLKKKSTNLTS
jgi:hypothetical protein